MAVDRSSLVASNAFDTKVSEVHVERRDDVVALNDPDVGKTDEERKLLVSSFPARTIVDRA
jgi:hypothetical protein